MLQLCYLGIAFAVVFYLVFGLAVKLMELSPAKRNSAHLGVLITSVSILIVPASLAGILNLRAKMYLNGILSLLLSAIAFFVLLSIVIELHNISKRIKIRRFMVLFNIVDEFISEGKTRDEILAYLTGIQKLKLKEATDFLEFITDPANHQFLADVNEQIQNAKLMGTIK